MSDAKIGAGALEAFIRQGAKELAQALPAFPDSNIRVVEEPGQMGNAVSREIYEQKHDVSFDARVEASARQMAARQVEPEREMERE